MTRVAPMTRSLRLSLIAAAGLVSVAIVLRLLDPFALPGPSVSAVVPILWALGALVVAGLAVSWAPTLAWFAVVVASTAGALAVAGVNAELRAGPATADGRLEILTTAALLIPPAIAGAYAAAGRRQGAVTAATWLVVGALTLVLVARAIVRSWSSDLEGTLPELVWLTVIAALLLIGLGRDLAPALQRTRERLQASGHASGASSALPALRVFVDELVPGRDVGRAEAVESERGRLAADLHAEVLPSLRRALAAAEAGGSVERLAADLRSAVDEVESLLLARRSIVLEEMGLLAGLEWLAERVEDRSTVRVEIEVTGSGTYGSVGDGAGVRDRAGGEGRGGEGDGAGVERRGGEGPSDEGPGGRPPRDVERAAFRVAQLALDNVVRHAPGSHARVAVAIGADRVTLRIEDDGDGPPVDEAAAARSGRRGIADMRAEARASGGTLDVGPRPGRGTRVDFQWPA